MDALYKNAFYSVKRKTICTKAFYNNIKFKAKLYMDFSPTCLVSEI